MILTNTIPDFDVALSFAGEDRTYVEEVAAILRTMGIGVFYDKYETVSLWGKNLYTHLQEIYSKRARYTVIFASIYYKEKLWTNHERESAQARAFTEKQEYILPARFDDTEIPGILPTTGYINLKDYTPVDFAQLIKKKLGAVIRTNFMPKTLDRLFDHLSVKSVKKQATITLIANELFELLKLTTREERSAIAIACQNACPAGVPDNVHLRLDYLARLMSKSEEDIISVFSRLDCLYIRTKVYENTSHQDEHSVSHASQIIEIKFEPLLVSYTGNATYVLQAIVEIADEYLCPECVKRAINDLDFAFLSRLTASEELH